MERAAGVYKHVLFPDGFGTNPPPLTEMQKAMLDVTPDCIKLLSSDGRLLNMNKAGCVALGIPEGAKLGMPWLPLLPEAIHPDGRRALAEAAKGQTARFNGESRNPDGVRYWDNLLTPIVDASGVVSAILCVSRDITAQTQAEKELHDALRREQLLSQEVQHRIKNAFAIMSGLISISEREAASVNDSEPPTSILRKKIQALARASNAAFSPMAIHNVGLDTVDIETVVTSVLEPYGGKYRIEGAATSIAYKNMTTIALFLHELATNSVKYGSLGAVDGHVDVHWARNDDDFCLIWTESGGPAVDASPGNAGFGSEMIDRIVQSVGGHIDKRWPREGLVVELHLPDSAATSP